MNRGNVLPASRQAPPAITARPRPGRLALAAVYLLFFGEVARTLVIADAGAVNVYLALFGAFLILFTLVLWRPALPRMLLRAYFVVQSAIVIALVALDPTIDHVTTLFVLLAYQSALVFDGYERWFWAGLVVALTGMVLIVFLGPLKGLGMALLTMAVGIILPAYVAANQETQAAEAGSQALLAALQERHRELKSYAGQVGELAAVAERNRLARELHDSVSQLLFSMTLQVRSTQILLERDPARVGPQLRVLQDLAQRALAGMRGVIEELRPEPAQAGPSPGPTT